MIRAWRQARIVEFSILVGRRRAHVDVSMPDVDLELRWRKFQRGRKEHPDSLDHCYGTAYMQGG
jgi:hypothetical protein